MAPSGMGSFGCGMKFKKPFSPKTVNANPIRIRTIVTDRFPFFAVRVSVVIVLFWLIFPVYFGDVSYFILMTNERNRTGHFFSSRFSRFAGLLLGRLLVETQDI